MHYSGERVRHDEGVFNTYPFASLRPGDLALKSFRCCIESSLAELASGLTIDKLLLS